MKVDFRDSRYLLALVLALPIIGVIGLIVRSELALIGYEWRFPITGYDPRDLLRGHYVTYRIDWDASELNDCRRCCICLERRGKQHVASRVECGENAPCDARVTPEDERNLSRFFIPEGRGAELDRAVRANKAEIVLVGRGGHLAIKELLVEGKSWRQYRE